MRVKTEAILDFGWADDLADNQTVRDYRQEYKALSEILDRRGEILDLVHRDLEQLSKATSHRGRKPTFTSENLFRAVLVMQRQALDYRQASIRIAESETLQRFCRLLKKPTMDFTLLNRAFAAIRPETWEHINHLLARTSSSQSRATQSRLTARSRLPRPRLVSQRSPSRTVSRPSPSRRRNHNEPFARPASLD